MREREKALLVQRARLIADLWPDGQVPPPATSLE
jgi:hypothetical protein